MRRRRRLAGDTLVATGPAMSVSRVGPGSPRDWIRRIRQTARRKGPNVARLSDCSRQIASGKMARAVTCRRRKAAALGGGKHAPEAAGVQMDRGASRKLDALRQAVRERWWLRRWVVRSPSQGV